MLTIQWNHLLTLNLLISDFSILQLLTKSTHVPKLYTLGSNICTFALGISRRGSIAFRVSRFSYAFYGIISGNRMVFAHKNRTSLLNRKLTWNRPIKPVKSPALSGLILLMKKLTKGTAWTIQLWKFFFRLLKSELLYLREFSSMEEFQIESNILIIIITEELRAN